MPLGTSERVGMPWALVQCGSAHNCTKLGSRFGDAHCLCYGLLIKRRSERHIV